MARECKWIVMEQADAEKVSRLATEVGIDRVLAELLVKRGVETFEQTRSFFRPQLSDLHDPFLMKDMDVAVERLRKAIVTKEKILVYGDYDVDGTTAVSLVYSFIKRFTDQVDFYIPDRNDEGYGVSIKGLDWAADNGFTLVITLDCGIKAIEKTRYAASRGIDFIICDHHLPDSELPPATIPSMTFQAAEWVSSLCRLIRSATEWPSRRWSRCWTTLSSASHPTSFPWWGRTACWRIMASGSSMKRRAPGFWP